MVFSRFRSEVTVLNPVFDKPKMGGTNRLIGYYLFSGLPLASKETDDGSDQPKMGGANRLIGYY